MVSVLYIQPLEHSIKSTSLKLFSKFCKLLQISITNIITNLLQNITIKLLQISNVRFKVCCKILFKMNLVITKLKIIYSFKD